MSASGFQQAPLWYTTRSSGIVAFVLLTISVILGIAATQRAVAHPRWPRFATQDLHRNISLLSMAMVVVHVTCTIVDNFVFVSAFSAVVPYAPSDYRRFWVMFGTLAADGVIVAALSGFLRARTSLKTWNWLHRSTYLSWSFAFLHFLKAGTDTTHGGWALYLDLACLALVAGAVIIRVSSTNDRSPVASLAASPQ